MSASSRSSPPPSCRAPRCPGSRSARRSARAVCSGRRRASSRTSSSTPPGTPSSPDSACGTPARSAPSSSGSSARPGRDDVLLSNFGWDALYWYTGRPLGMRIAPDAPVRGAAERMGLPAVRLRLRPRGLAGLARRQRGAARLPADAALVAPARGARGARRARRAARGGRELSRDALGEPARALLAPLPEGGPPVLAARTRRRAALLPGAAVPHPLARTRNEPRRAATAAGRATPPRSVARQARAARPVERAARLGLHDRRAVLPRQHRPAGLGLRRPPAAVDRRAGALRPLLGDSIFALRLPAVLAARRRCSSRV